MKALSIAQSGAVSSQALHGLGREASGLPKEELKSSLKVGTPLRVWCQDNIHLIPDYTLGWVRCRLIVPYFSMLYKTFSSFHVLYTHTGKNTS